METISTHTLMQGLLSHNPFIAVFTIIAIGFIILLLYGMKTSGKTIHHNKERYNKKTDTVVSLMVGILMGASTCNYFNFQLLSMVGAIVLALSSFEAMVRMRNYFDNDKSPVCPMGRYTN